MSVAGVAHPVERHLAKVEVASSSLVTRSKLKKRQMRKHLPFLCLNLTNGLDEKHLLDSSPCFNTGMMNTGKAEQIAAHATMELRKI